MSSAALLVLAIALLPAFGMAACVWLVFAIEAEDERALAGVEGMKFESQTGHPSVSLVDGRRGLDNMPKRSGEPAPKQAWGQSPVFFH